MGRPKPRKFNNTKIFRANYFQRENFLICGVLHGLYILQVLIAL